MFEQLVLLTAVMLGVTFVRLARRLEPGQRGYMIVVGGVLTMALVSLFRDSRFLGVAAVAFGVLVVLVPWVLEALARAAFTRGKLTLAVRLAGLRALLMPGAGLSRQQEILRGLALLERDGVDRALGHFRGLAGDTEDGGELALINEQIVSMLFYGQRWDEGIAHYEARFHPRYAAMRPALALGLLRAYGESGKLETAAGLLRALEEGPVGADPRALGLISQARLTFLAYAGAAMVVTEALTDDRRRQLGLSAASGALFRGIALERAGHAGPARDELKRVETLARAADDRVVDASRLAITRLEGFGDAGASPVELDSDLRSYVAAVAERLQNFLRAAPGVRRPGSLIATPLLVTAVIGGYLFVLWYGRGGLGLLAGGALTPELWYAGSWGRAIVGVFPQADPIGTLLNVYAIWLAAPLVERVYGSARLLVAAVAGAAAGLVCAVAVEHDPAAVFAGANLMASAVTAGALWTLLPFRTPALPQRSRRALAIPLALVAVAQVISIYRGLLAVDVPAVGLAISAGVGVLVIGLVPQTGKGATLLRWLAAPLLIAIGAAAFQVSREDPEAFAAARLDRVLSVDGVRFEVPLTMVQTERREEFGVGLPVQAGIVDSLALRTADVVQFVVAPPPADPSAPRETILLQIEPALRHELTVAKETEVPAALAEAYASAGGDLDAVESFVLRRNGVAVARVIERTLADTDPAVRIALISAPRDAVLHAPAVYGAVLASARAEAAR